MLKTETVVFHVLIISTNACTGKSEIQGGYKRLLCQKAIAHTFFELKIFFPVYSSGYHPSS